MEDMARLALVEQSVRNAEKFSNILYELLRHVNHILENPHDYELRTIKSEGLKKLLQYEAFVDYLKSIGFEKVENEYTYPKEQTLSNLRIAQAALERKIYFCYGSLTPVKGKVKFAYNLPKAKMPQLKPSKVLLVIKNPFLLKIEAIFNDILKYEDEELLELARNEIPIVTLQLMAIDRVREHQRKMKAGEIQGRELPFDIALLMELIQWFKYKYFSWVDAPPCESCGGPTKHQRNSFTTTETEHCKVELYKCEACPGGGARFPRYNDARTLLRTRRGRCGEWANAFTLLSRALGYDVRYVYDTTDHVWCEVFDYDSNTWLHVDPCEGKLNAPLMYTHGWNKKLSYVIAFSRDDLQDVTWRYTSDHKEVLKRRTQCEEKELISTILALREHRQRQVSEARRRYLTKRCLEEIVQLMVERKPSDYESHGRISGSQDWRERRGEARVGHEFRFSCAGACLVRYHCARDVYRVRDSAGSRELASWATGARTASRVHRMVENDWQMAYIAREEGEETGSISWAVAAEGQLQFSSLSVRAASQLYEDGQVDWTVTFDDEQPLPVKIDESGAVFSRRFVRASVAATLRGGRGDVAWQHAQLFRQPLAAADCTFELLAELTHAQ